jgi:hypothetical protein
MAVRLSPHRSEHSVHCAAEVGVSTSGTGKSNILQAAPLGTTLRSHKPAAVSFGLGASVLEETPDTVGELSSRPAPPLVPGGRLRPVQPGEIQADTYRNTPDAPPAAFQITVTIDDVEHAYADALAAGGAKRGPA